MIRLYNTLTRSKEEFRAPDPGKVGIYCLRSHGLRPPSPGQRATLRIFAVVRSWFRHRGLQSEFVENFTDVDDKIINPAQGGGARTRRGGGEYTRGLPRRTWTARLGAGPQTSPASPRHPRDSTWCCTSSSRRATPTRRRRRLLPRPPLPRLRQALRAEHRRLGRRAGRGRARQARPARLRAVEGGQARRAGVGQPLGPGRPGWHIECSAIACSTWATARHPRRRRDLIFPHHENEIAQTEAAGKPFA